MPKKAQGVLPNYEEYRKMLASEIGSRIRDKRIAINFTQETLRAKLELERVHISRSHYSRIELGENLPDAILIIALSRILEVPPNWLLLGE